MTKQPSNAESTEEAVSAIEFQCARCSGSVPMPHQGRTIDGQPYCIPCSLEVTTKGVSSEVTEETAEQVGRIESQQEKQAKKDKSRQWKIGLLAAALFLILIEAGLLVFTSPAAPPGDQQAKVEFASTFMVFNALEQFKSAEGYYPVILEQLVPTCWDEADITELQNFSYRRTARDRFLLERMTTSADSRVRAGANNQQAVLRTVDDQTRISDLFATTARQ